MWKRFIFVPKSWNQSECTLLCKRLLDASKNMQRQCQSKLCERKKHHCHHHHHHHHYHQSTIIVFAIVVKKYSQPILCPAYLQQSYLLLLLLRQVCLLSSKRWKMKSSSIHSFYNFGHKEHKGQFQYTNHLEKYLSLLNWSSDSAYMAFSALLAISARAFSRNFDTSFCPDHRLSL